MLDESVLQSKATTAQIDEAEKFYNCATGMNPFAWIYVVYPMIVTETIAKKESFMKRKILYVCVSLILLLSTVFTLSSCFLLYDFLETKYQDFGPEIFGLYAEAGVSVPFQTEVSIPKKQAFRYDPETPDIEIVERDEFGRILYLHRTWAHTVHGKRLISGISLLICQKANEEFVFFYPNTNCMSYFVFPSDWTLEQMEAFAFSDEQVNRLKEENDWGKALDLSKCVVHKIEKGKKTSGSIDEKGDELIAPLKNILLDPTGMKSDRYCNSASDPFGRELFVVEFQVAHYNKNLPFFDDNCATVALIFQPDGSCDPQTYFFFKSIRWYGKENDPFDIQYHMEEDDGWSRFLKANHWNEPIS